MRIDSLNQVSRLYKANSTRKTDKVRESKTGDTFELSQTGKDYQVTRQIIAQTPDIREDKVNDIKNRMQAGTYLPNMNLVAEKLVDKYFS